MKNNKQIFILLLLMIFAASIRLYKITEKGIFFHDEAVQMLEGKFVKSCVTFIWDNLRGTKSFNQMKDSLRGWVMFSGKPTNAILLSTGFLVFGDHDYAAFIFYTLCGLFMIYAVYLTAKTMFDQRTGLYAALMLSISAMHTYFSRSGYSEMLGGSLLVLAVYFYYTYRIVDKRLRRLSVTGILLGLIFTVHYRWLIILVAFEILESLSYAPFKEKIKRLLTLNIFIALPLLAYEAVFRSLRLFLKDSYNLTTYFEQISQRICSAVPFFFLKSGSGTGMHSLFTRFFGTFTKFKGWIFYRYIIDFDGIIFFLIVMSGLLYVIISFLKKSHIKYLLLIIFFPLLYGFWGFWQTLFPRITAILLPFVAVVAGVGLNLIMCKIQLKSFRIVFLGALILIAVYNCLKIDSLKSEFKTAVYFTSDYILRNKKPPMGILGPPNSHDIAPIWFFYAEEYSDEKHIPVKVIFNPYMGTKYANFYAAYPICYRFPGYYLGPAKFLMKEGKLIYEGRLDWANNQCLMEEGEFSHTRDPDRIKTFSTKELSFFNDIKILDIIDVQDKLIKN